MATRTGSAVLKRLAWLNRSGLLSKPLQYSQVKGSLDSFGEELALEVLKQLEEEAAGVSDPVEFVKEAAAGHLEGQAPAVAGVKKRKATGEGGEGGEESIGEAGALGEEGGVVAKRVRLLNGSGHLAQPIIYSRVREGLHSLGVAQAMTILKGLEDVAEDVRDPTSYIRTAVRGAGGTVPMDGLDAGAREEVEEGDSMGEPTGVLAESAEGTATERSSRGVTANWQGVKLEPMVGRQHGPKAEDFTEAEKLERRVRWLNRNGGLVKPIDFDEVLPALDCIGFRQAMRVLKRLEESGSTVSDPGEFIKDSVARSGWIWAKPDIIDDDEKVAKRVAWMNLFGGLLQPIDYAQVADVLDSLKVPHAMVLLRELEVQAHKVDDPTEYIKRTAGLAGEDEVQVPVVDEDSSVAQRVAQLNEAGKLAGSIEYAEIGEDLMRIGDEHALQLLQEVEDKGASVKDPTGYIKFKLKAKLASLGTTLEESADDETKILKRIEWLNDYGGLLQDIDYDRVSMALGAAGVEHAMTVLKELEDKRGGVRDPNAFILAALGGASRAGAPPVRAPPPMPRGARGAQGAAAAAPGAADLETLAGFVGFLNRRPRAKGPVKFGEVAHALDSLGPRRAARVLKEMQERGLGQDDPVAYIRAAAQRTAGMAFKKESEEGDDVAKITKRLNWLNQFGGLSKKIGVNEVVGALYCLGLPQSMAILRGLQEKGARVPNPTAYIKTAIQRANGVRVAASAPLAKEEFAVEHGEVDGEEGAEENEDGAVEDFEDPEGDDDVGEVGHEGAEAFAGADTIAKDEGDEAEVFDGEAVDDALLDDDEVLAAGDESLTDGLHTAHGDEVLDINESAMKKLAAKQPGSTMKAKTAASGERRVVGGLTGYNKLVPLRAGYNAGEAAKTVKTELVEDDIKQEEEPKLKPPTLLSSLPITPQEKLVQVRDLAVKHGLQLDHLCLKSLARLPFHKAKDMIDDVLLGGRNRKGVANPSRYLTIAVQKLSAGLGVEQGLAMELAVSLGVVLNNDALDELACIPRKESHAIIREIARNEEARKDPIRFIQAEVMKTRAQMDARPWPPTS